MNKKLRNNASNVMADGDKERKRRETDNMKEDKDKMGIVRFSKRPVMIPLETTERKKLFRQRKYVTIDVKVDTHILTEYENISRAIKSNSAECGLANTNDENPEIHINDEPDAGSESVQTEHELITDYEGDDLPVNLKHRIEKDYSLESTYSVDAESGGQPGLSSKSSLSTQMSDTIPGHWKSDNDRVSDESCSESELSSNDVTNKKMLSISDSEECDTDLEIDPNFGKGTIVLVLIITKMTARPIPYQDKWSAVASKCINLITKRYFAFLNCLISYAVSLLQHWSCPFYKAGTACLLLTCSNSSYSLYIVRFATTAWSKMMVIEMELLHFYPH